MGGRVDRRTERRAKVLLSAPSLATGLNVVDGQRIVKGYRGGTRQSGGFGCRGTVVGGILRSSGLLWRILAEGGAPVAGAVRGTTGSAVLFLGVFC